MLGEKKKCYESQANNNNNLFLKETSDKDSNSLTNVYPMERCIKLKWLLLAVKHESWDSVGWWDYQISMCKYYSLTHCAMQAISAFTIQFSNNSSTFLNKYFKSLTIFIDHLQHKNDLKQITRNVFVKTVI